MLLVQSLFILRPNEAVANLIKPLARVFKIKAYFGEYNVIIVERNNK